MALQGRAAGGPIARRPPCACGHVATDAVSLRARSQVAHHGDRGRRFNLGDRRQRARVYEIVLREGGPADVLRYVDGALLVDRWDDLVLPATVRTAWAPVVATRTEVPSS